jgi:prepilin-type N-terminal cleavage/methylation domain-containing protein
MIKNFLKHFRYGQKGFTLIEMLVVVAILGVLSAVAIPNVGKFVGRGQVEKANTEFTTIQNAIATYQSDGYAITEELDAEAVSAIVRPYLQNPVIYDYILAYDAGQITITGVDGDPSKAFVAGLQWDDAHSKWMTIP